MDLSIRAQEMPNTPIRKYNKLAIEAENAGKKIYRLNIGQPDIATPSCFNDAIKEALPKVISYTESDGNLDLLEAITKYFKMYDADYDTSDIIVTHGGSEALNIAFASVLNPGDELLVPEPFYTNYQVFVGNSSASLVPVKTCPKDGYRYATEKQLEEALTSKTKAICVNSPNNPTGVVLTHDEMEIVCKFAEKHDLWIISDETYREFVFDEHEVTTFARMNEYADRIIIVDSVSKRYSACGARIGYIASKNSAIIDFALKVAQGRLCVPYLEQIGTKALIELPRSFYKEIVDEYEARRDAVLDELAKIPDVLYKKPDGAFYITIKLPVDDAEKFLVFLLSEFSDNGETVMFSPAEGFYLTPGLGRSEIRLAYVLNSHDMRRGIELIRLGLKAYNNRQ